LVRLRRARVPVRYGRRLKALQGTSRVEAAEFEGGEGVRCDAVGLCFGFVPQSELARAAGAKMRRAGAAGGWAAIADEWHQSTVPKLFVAGETTGVQGAEIAGIEGAIAGIGIALTAGIVTGIEASSRAAPYRRRYKRAAAFAALLEAVADPTAYWPDVEPETLACRCEDVSFADLGAAIAASASANGVKLASRCGMGLCQGRNCEPTLLRLLAQAGRMDDPGFTARFPARPTAIGDLVR
jgi:NAD(P)H-nitrite reductase large subunit